MSATRRPCGWPGMAWGVSGLRDRPLYGPVQGSFTPSQPPPLRAGEGFFSYGSGRAGGRRRSRVERIDRWFADEEAEDLAHLVWFQS